MSEDRGILHDSDVLLRQIDSQLARQSARESARGGGPTSELVVAEKIAAALRRLVAGTAESCATDRARVRAAVHFFLVRRDVRQDRRPARPVSADIRVINEIMHELGRDDLAIDATPAVDAAPATVPAPSMAAAITAVPATVPPARVPLGATRVPAGAVPAPA